MTVIKSMITTALLILAACPVFSAGRVSLLVGDVRIQTAADREWEPVKQGRQVETGDTVKTGDDSYVEISSSEATIRIDANSRVRISKSMVNEKEADSLSMFFGSVFLKIAKLGKDDGGFAVETPASFCAVRGTEFAVASGFDGHTIVQVEKGTVSLSGSEGEVVISENQESEVSLGGAPTGVTRIKKRAWREWIRQNRESMKGKELAVLRGAMKRMMKLGRDIEILEGLNEKLSRQKEELQAMADEFKSKGDDANFREYSARAHRAKRGAYVAMNEVFYKAEKLDLIRNLAVDAYEGLATKMGEGGDARSKIEEIFNRNNERYIRKIRSGDSMRQKILEKRRNRKAQGE